MGMRRSDQNKFCWFTSTEQPLTIL